MPQPAKQAKRVDASQNEDSDDEDDRPLALERIHRPRWNNGPANSQISRTSLPMATTQAVLTCGKQSLGQQQQGSRCAASQPSRARRSSIHGSLLLQDDLAHPSSAPPQPLPVATGRERQAAFEREQSLPAAIHEELGRVHRDTNSPQFPSRSIAQDARIQALAKHRRPHTVRLVTTHSKEATVNGLSLEAPATQDSVTRSLQRIRSQQLLKSVRHQALPPFLMVSWAESLAQMARLHRRSQIDSLRV